MFRSLLEYLCSRPYPEAPRWPTRLRAVLWALGFGLLAFVVGAVLGGDFAVPGENTTALAALSGSPVVMEFVGPQNVLWASHPLLWTLAGAFGEVPSMGALNLLGAAVMGLTVMLTWLLVRFWCLDGMGEESGRLAKMRWSWVAAGAVCLVLTFTMPGLYGATALTFNAWGFMLLLLCVVLQNVYAMNGGQRRWMAVASIVLGVCAVETPWVLLFLPVLFLRAVMTEWRLWDHSAKNLPIWFLGLALGAGVTLAFNTWRVTGGLSPTALWGVEREVLAQVALPTITGWFVGPWLINLGGAVVLPLVAWGVARRLMDNVRSVGLMVAGLVVTAGAVALQWGLEALSPWANWLGLGAQPLAVGWTGALACGMLVAGWGVQLFVKAPAYADPDTHREPTPVKAGRIIGGVTFVALVAGLATMGWVQTERFCAMDRGMATRFAGETVEALQRENRTYLLGSRLGVIDPHLALVARERGFPLTIFVLRLADRLGMAETEPDSEAEKALDAALRRNTYAARLRRRLEEDPALGVGDRLRLTHLLDYNFYVFVEDFFKAQPNVREIAAAYDRADVWSALDAHRVTEDVGAGAQRALPKGTFYLPTPAQHLASETEVEALLAAQRDLQTRWAPVVEGEPLSWWDLNRSTQGAVRRHLAFMANNLGVWLNDQGALAEAQALEANHQGRTEEAQTLAATAQKRLAQAADCYYYAFKTNPENLSAKLNAFYLCVERGFLPEHREEIRTDFEAFAKSLQETGRRYDFGSVGYIHGYIRNYAFFVQRGWGWAATAAPEAVLSYLGGRRAALGDASLANINVATAAVYELHGQLESSEALYRGVLKYDPDNFESLRGLARLALQRGNLQEAGRYLARAGAVVDVYMRDFDARKSVFAEALSRADACLISKDSAGAIEALKGATDLPKESYEKLLKEAEGQGNALFRAEALRGLTRIALRDGDPSEAARFLVRARQALDEARPPLTPLIFDQAAYLMAMGDLDGAAKEIAAYLKANPEALDGWAMLAMIEIERGDKARAANNESRAEEHYRVADGYIAHLTQATGQDAYFAAIIRGRLAQSAALKAEAGAVSSATLPPAARARWKEARDHYHRAYTLRPRIRRRLLESILHIDRRLGDKSAAETDAFAILRDEPSNPFANFVIGTQRMEAANFNEARRYFGQAYDALGQASGLELLNNYAETLARSDNPDDRAKAVRIAEDASLRLAPANYVLRATYALTLVRAGKLEEAREALQQSRDIAEKLKLTVDPRIAFVDAWIALGEGKKDEARRIADTLRVSLGATLTPRDRADLEALRTASAK